MGQQETHTPYEKQLVALESVLETLREEEDLNALIETTLSYLKREFQYRLIWIGLYDRAEHRLSGKGGVVPNGDTALLKAKFSLSTGDILEQVTIQQRPVSIPDLRKETRAGEWQKVARELEVQGTLAYPLRCKGMCFGVILLGSHLWGVTPRTTEKATLSLLFGSLAATLYQLEVKKQHDEAKRPDRPMFQMLDKLQNLPALQARLEVVVNATQEFIAPTRTNLYWYAPQQRYFWKRVGHKQTSRRSIGETATANLTVLEISDFYLALAAGQTVAIGSGKSPLKQEATGNVLSRLRSRSVLAAPILLKGELVGFLATEADVARIWEEGEENYVRAAAGAIALVAGNEDTQATLEQIQQEARLIAEVAAAITSNAEPHEALEQCAYLILKYLDVERFLVLQPEVVGAEVNSQQSYTIFYQQQPPKSRPVDTSLNVLDGADWQLIAQSSPAVAIEDWEKDQRLKPWRDCLMQLGVRSLAVCRTGTSPADAMLAIARGTQRTWNDWELRALSVVGQQIGLLLHSWAIQHGAEYSSVTLQNLQAALTALVSAAADPAKFERTWVQYLADVLQAPLVALLGWSPQNPYQKIRQVASIQASAVSDPELALPPDLSIAIASDPLIREAIATDGFVWRSVADLPIQTLNWLSNPNIGQVTVIALHTTSKTAPTGLLLIASKSDSTLSSHLFPPLEIPIRQFATLRQYLRLSASLGNEVKNLEQLNWYKHRCLETLHHAVATSVSAMVADCEGQGEQSVEQPVWSRKSSQSLHQLQKTLSSLNAVFNEEQWQLQMRPVPVIVEAAVKRSLLRLESLYKQRQISVKVHPSGNLSISCDLFKLECVLFELLLTSCYRAKSKSRIDFWCRSIEPKKRSHESEGEPTGLPYVELLIADRSTDIQDSSSSADGYPAAAFDLSKARSEQPPTLHLKIVGRVLRSWGGDLQFYQTEDKRFLSRLLLPKG